MTERTSTQHILPDELWNRAVVIHVIGCGGTGSQLLPRLAQLHKSMLALGHPAGLAVTVWDPDEVSAHNCLRQNFFECDVHQKKASVMVNRLNMAHGLTWQDRPEYFSVEAMKHDRADFIIGCVDSKKGRREIEAFVRNSWNTTYWIDAGNESDSGQVIVGQGGRRIENHPLRLPLVSELYPEIVNGEDDNAPSCSARESIFKQGLATNPMAATWVYAWLAHVLRFGKIDYCGVFFNLTAGRSSPIPVDPAVWASIRPAAPVALPEAA